MNGRETMLNEIIERELRMFLATPNEGGTASCQERPDTFRLMRRMVHEIHSDAFLESYLEDLRLAERQNRNFMLEKYARMDNRLPPLSDNPLLDAIVEAEIKFREEALPQCGGMIRAGSGDYFRRYLRSELETLSDKSLELYNGEMEAAKKAGRNPVLERYRWLARQLGRDG